MKIAPDLCFPYCYEGYRNQTLEKVTNCEEIWSAEQNVHVAVIDEYGKRSKVSCRISNLVEMGTLPVADIFCYCGQGTVIRQTLPPYWGRECAPIILIGSLRILPLGMDKELVVPRRKRRFSLEGKEGRSPSRYPQRVQGCGRSVHRQLDRIPSMDADEKKCRMD